MTEDAEGSRYCPLCPQGAPGTIIWRAVPPTRDQGGSVLLGTCTDCRQTFFRCWECRRPNLITVLNLNEPVQHACRNCHHLYSVISSPGEDYGTVDYDVIWLGFHVSEDDDGLLQKVVSMLATALDIRRNGEPAPGYWDSWEEAATDLLEALKPVR